MGKRGRKPIPETTQNTIENIFVSEMHIARGKHPKAVDVWQTQNKQLRDDALAESTVRGLVAGLRTKYPEGDNLFNSEEWQPSWNDLHGRPHEEVIAVSQVNELLFRMNRLKLSAQFSMVSKTRPVKLLAHEAEWAVRLHRPLSDAHPMIKILMTLWYAEREVIGHYKKEPPELNDLDTVLMYKPWLGGEHFQNYEKAIICGNEPIPKVYYNEGLKQNGKSIILSLKGIDALLFAFWGVIVHPSLIWGIVWSVSNEYGARLASKWQSLNEEPRFEENWFEGIAILTKVLETKDTDRLSPLLRILVNPVADLIYKKLRTDDHEYILSSLAKAHKSPREDWD